MNLAGQVPASLEWWPRFGRRRRRRRRCNSIPNPRKPTTNERCDVLGAGYGVVRFLPDDGGQSLFDYT